MFSWLFSESGLSLERLRAFVEVGAAGGIVRATGGEPSRQSLYSRQIKELESFFRTGLVERHGKGIRLTSRGRELARISRFFLLGLANFKRGCLAAGQTYRVGAGATLNEHVLVPLLSKWPRGRIKIRHEVEIESDEEIERRLHDLTLDFGVVSVPSLSRPLQVRPLGMFHLALWVPRSLCRTERAAVTGIREKRLPFVYPKAELPFHVVEELFGYEPELVCGTFTEAKAALEQGGLAAFLPTFLPAPAPAGQFLKVAGWPPAAVQCDCQLAWNPRLLRLNPNAARRLEEMTTMIRGEIVRLTKRSDHIP